VIELGSLEFETRVLYWIMMNTEFRMRQVSY
jgi:hypothetical protein